MKSRLIVVRLKSLNPDTFQVNTPSDYLPEAIHVMQLPTVVIPKGYSDVSRLGVFTLLVRSKRPVDRVRLGNGRRRVFPESKFIEAAFFRFICRCTEFLLCRGQNCRESRVRSRSVTSPFYVCSLVSS